MTICSVFDRFPPLLLSVGDGVLVGGSREPVESDSVIVWRIMVSMVCVVVITLAVVMS